MRIPAQRFTRAQVARTVSVPAPVGGWNARDSLADMNKRDAVILDNLFPTVTDVRARKGYTQHATGMTGLITSLMSYSPPSGGAKLFAAVGSNIFDVTSSGAVGAASATGFTSDKFQHCNFGTGSGGVLVICNGSDSVRSYNGSWTTHTFTGVTSANLINVNAHKNRLWFVEKNTMKAWYNTTSNAIAGTYTAFPFDSIMTRGGYLVAMGTWTLDVGFGIDDYAVFISSEGQVAVYQGTDPSNANTWSLIGVYQVGSPIGYRCLTKYGGDLFLVLKEGLTPLSIALKTEADTNNRRVTQKIQNAVNEYVQQYSGNFGWQCLLYPSENMLLLNIPTTTTGSSSVQVCMNTITGSWCRFTGWDAACWERHNDDIYFGGTNFVGKAWNTYADNGNYVQFEGLQAFNSQGANTQMKQVKMLRPVIATDGGPAVLMGVNADFDQSAPVGLLVANPVAAGVWGTGLWDAALWGGDPTIQRNWQTAFAMGYSFAAHLIGKTSVEQFRWISTDYLIQDAGVI